MNAVASYTGGSIFILIGLVMIVILLKTQEKTNSKLLPPGTPFIRAGGSLIHYFHCLFLLFLYVTHKS